MTEDPTYKQYYCVFPLRFVFCIFKKKKKIYQHFYLFFTHNIHNIQNITKQNNRHILNISKSSQKGGREGRTIKTQTSHSFIQTRISKRKHCQASMVEGLAPTNSRRCTFTRHYLQEATDPICFSTRVV